MKKNRIIGLDIFRFMAACGILCYHYFFIGVLEKFYSPSIFHNVAFWGEFGVDIFFILSGFVILISAEKTGSALQFLKSRLKRVYPTFILCSLILVLTGILMPGNTLNSLIIKWLNSMTFISDFWGGSLLSGIYWTLVIEIKFYILVTIIKYLKIWDKYKYIILLLWVVIGFLNINYLHINLLDTVLLAKYSGHFSLGIIMYILYKDNKNINHLIFPTIVLSSWLIYTNMIGFTNWIRSLYPALPFSDIEIFFAFLFIIGCFIAAINTHKSFISNKIAEILGAISFNLYLIHADFGYFIKTQYYLRFENILPFKINDSLLSIMMIILSFALSFLTYYIIDKIMRLLKNKKSSK